MMILRQGVLAAVIVGAVTLAAPAKADDAAGVKATIAAQLDAFAAGDAKTAFSFAAPGIKEMFGTPDRFIAMVRRGYKPVYDANAPTFLRTETLEDGSVAQEVGLVDDEGSAWTALYTLAKGEDGAWRITGCFLRRAPGQAV